MSYLANVAKSFGRAAPVIAKKEFEGAFALINTFTGSNSEEIKSIFKDTGSFVGGEVQSKLTDALSKVKEQVKTGEFYKGEEDEDKAFSEAMGFNEDDFFGDDDYDEYGDSDSDDSDTTESPSPSESMRSNFNADNSMAAGEMTSNAVILGASTTANAMYSAANVTRSAIGKMAQANYHMQSATLKFMNDESAASAIYRERMFGLVADVKETLDGIKATSEKAAAFNGNYDVPEDSSSMSSGVMEDGRLNFTRYFDQLSKKIRKPFESGGDFQMALAALGNPIMEGISMGFTSVFESDKFKIFTDSINLLGELPTAFMMKINEWSIKHDDKWYGKLAKFFAPESARVGNEVIEYNKGAVPYNGMANRSIIQVIPGLLSKILLETRRNGGAKLTNADQSAYDYEKGRFTTHGALSKDLRDEGAFAKTTMLNESTKLMEGKKFKTKSAEKAYEDSIQSYILRAGKSGKMFHQLNSDDLGDLSDSSIHRDMQRMYAAMSTSEKAKLTKKFSSVGSQAKLFQQNNNDKYGMLHQEDTGFQNSLRANKFTNKKGNTVSFRNTDELLTNPEHDVDIAGYGYKQPNNIGQRAAYKYQSWIGKKLYGGGMEDLEDSEDDGGFGGMFKRKPSDPTDTPPQSMWDKAKAGWNKAKSGIKYNQDNGMYSSANSSFSEDIKKFTVNLRESFTSTFNKYYSDLKDKVSTLTSFIADGFKENVFKPIKNTFEKVKGDFGNWFGKKKDAAYSSLFGTTKPLDWINAKLEPMTAAIKEKATAVWDDVSKFAKSTFTKTKDYLVDVTMGTPEKPGFVRSIGNAFKDGVITPFKENVVDKFTSAFSSIGGTGSADLSWSDKLYQASKDAISKSVDFVTRKTSEIFGSGTLKTFDEFKNKAFDYASFYWEKSSKFLNDRVWTPLQAKIQVFSDKVTEVAQTFATKSKDFFNEYLFGDGSNSFKSNVLKPTGEWLSSKVFTPFKEEVKEVWSSATKFVQTNLVEPLKDTMSPFLQELKMQFSMLKDWGFEYAGKLSESVSSVFSKANEASGKFFSKSIGDVLEERVLNPIKDTWDTFKTWFGNGIKTMTSKFTGFIREKSDNLRSKHFIQGNSGYMDKDNLIRLHKEGKIKLTGEQLTDWKLKRQSFMANKAEKEARSNALKEERGYHSKLRSMARDKADSDKIAKNKANGKMSFFDKLYDQVANTGDKAKSAAEKMKNQLFGDKDIKSEKTAAGKAAVVTANESHKQTKIADDQLDEARKSTNILDKILNIFKRNKFDSSTSGSKSSKGTKGNSGSNSGGNGNGGSRFNTDNRSNSHSNSWFNSDNSDNSTNNSTNHNSSTNSTNSTSHSSSWNENESGATNTSANQQTALNSTFIKVSSEGTRRDVGSIKDFIYRNLGNTSKYLRSIAHKVAGKGGMTSALFGADIKKDGFFKRLFSGAKGGLGGMLNGIIGTTLRGFGNLITAPFRLLDGMVTGIGKTFGKVTSALGSFIQGIGAASKGFANAAGTIVEGLAKGVSGILENTGKVIGAAVEHVGTALNTVFSGVTSIMSTTISIMSQMVTKVLPAMLGVAGNVMKGIGYGAMGAGKALAGAMGLIYRGRRSKLQKVFIEGGFLDGIRNSVGTHLRSPKLDVIKDLTPLGAKSRNTDDIDYGNPLESIMQSLNETMDKLAKSVFSIKETMLDPKKRKIWIAQKLDDTQEWLKDKKHQVRGAIAYKTDQIKNSIQEKWGDKINPKIADAKTWYNNKKSNIRNSFETFASKFVSTRNFTNSNGNKEDALHESNMQRGKSALQMKVERVNAFKEKKLNEWRNSSLKAQLSSSKSLEKIHEGFKFAGTIFRALGAGMTAIVKPLLTWLGGSKLVKLGAVLLGGLKGTIATWGSKIIAALGFKKLMGGDSDLLDNADIGGKDKKHKKGNERKHYPKGIKGKLLRMKDAALDVFTSKESSNLERSAAKNFAKKAALGGGLATAGALAVPAMGSNVSIADVNGNLVNADNIVSDNANLENANAVSSARGGLSGAKLDRNGNPVQRSLVTQMQRHSTSDGINARGAAEGSKEFIKVAGKNVITGLKSIKTVGKIATGAIVGTAVSAVTDKFTENMPDGTAKTTVDTIGSAIGGASTGAMIGTFLAGPLGTAVGAGVGTIVGMLSANWDSITQATGRAVFGHDAKFDKYGVLVEERSPNILGKLWSGIFGNKAEYGKDGNVTRYESDSIVGNLWSGIFGRDAKRDANGNLVQTGSKNILGKLSDGVNSFTLGTKQFALDFKVGWDKSLIALKSGMSGLVGSFNTWMSNVGVSIKGFLSDWAKNLTNGEWYKSKLGKAKDALVTGVKSVGDKLNAGDKWIDEKAKDARGWVSNKWDSLTGKRSTSATTMYSELAKTRVDSQIKDYTTKNADMLKGLNQKDRDKQMQLASKRFKSAEIKRLEGGFVDDELAKKTGLDVKEIAKMSEDDKAKLYSEHVNAEVKPVKAFKSKTAILPKAINPTSSVGVIAPVKTPSQALKTIAAKDSTGVAFDARVITSAYAIREITKTGSPVNSGLVEIDKYKTAPDQLLAAREVFSTLGYGDLDPVSIDDKSLFNIMLQRGNTKMVNGGIVKSTINKISVTPINTAPALLSMANPTKANVHKTFKFSTDLPAMVTTPVKNNNSVASVNANGTPVLIDKANPSAAGLSENKLKMVKLDKSETNKQIAKYNPSDGENALIKAMNSSGMVNGTERKMFMTQMAHESMDFKRLNEMASGEAYEGRKDLGNTQLGDGVRYKGRGFIQLTGRSNYQIYGNQIGLDLINHPELAAKPDIAAAIAIAYWNDRVNRRAAQTGDVVTVTRNINGGKNGLADRIRRFNDPKNNKYAGSDYVAPYIAGGDISMSTTSDSVAATNKVTGMDSMNMVNVGRMLKEKGIDPTSILGKINKSGDDSNVNNGKTLNKYSSWVNKKPNIDKLDTLNETNPKVNNSGIPIVNKRKEVSNVTMNTTSSKAMASTASGSTALADQLMGNNGAITVNTDSPKQVSELTNQTQLMAAMVGALEKLVTNTDMDSNMKKAILDITKNPKEIVQPAVNNLVDKGITQVNNNTNVFNGKVTEKERTIAKNYLSTAMARM